MARAGTGAGNRVALGAILVVSASLVHGCPLENYEYWSMETSHPVEVVDSDAASDAEYVLTWFLYNTGMVYPDLYTNEHPEVLGEETLEEPGWVEMSGKGEWNDAKVQLPLTFAAWRNDGGSFDPPSFDGSSNDPCAFERFDEVPAYGSPIRLEVAYDGCCHVDEEHSEFGLLPGWLCSPDPP